MDKAESSSQALEQLSAVTARRWELVARLSESGEGGGRRWGGREEFDVHLAAPLVPAPRFGLQNRNKWIISLFHSTPRNAGGPVQSGALSCV
jgi:hypothetical protein